MSVMIRSITRSHVGEVYSAKSPFPNQFAGKDPFTKTRITDSVHISEEALRKYKQSKEMDSAEPDTPKQVYSIENLDVKESLSVLEIASSDKISMDELKKAFILAVKKYHPDKHSQSEKEIRDFAEKKTREIIAAYVDIQKILSQ